MTAKFFVEKTIHGNVLENLAIHDLNNWAIWELLLVDLAKTQYTRDDEGPYFCINVDQQRYRYIVYSD